MGQVRAQSQICLGLKPQHHQPALGAALEMGKDPQLFEKRHECGDGGMTGE